MKVSFIVPVYNVAKYLGECIESILAQEENDFEIILVNDGSKDNSEEICKEYARQYSNIKMLTQKNQGVSVARNRGIEISEGKWIFFVDGDDTVSPKLLTECSAFLNNQNDVCFVRHKEVIEGNQFVNKTEIKGSGSRSVFFLKEDFIEFERAVFNRDYKGKYDYHNLKMSTPCKFYRKEILNKGNISFPQGISTGEDAIFNLLIYREAETGVYIDNELYYHRVWENSVSQKYDPNVEKKFEAFHKKLEEYIFLEGKSKKIYDAYNERCLWSIGFFCILKYCNKYNKDSYQIRKKQFEQSTENYKYEIKNAKLKNFRFEKKILFFCIKNNLFLLTNILCLLKKNV